MIAAASGKHADRIAVELSLDLLTVKRWLAGAFLSPLAAHSPR
jgi:hypothetical protein